MLDGDISDIFYIDTVIINYFRNVVINNRYVHIRRSSKYEV